MSSSSSDLGPGSSIVTPTMENPPRIPARLATVRQQFNARAQRFAKADILPRTVGARMVERLAFMRLVPDRIVDVGCGLGSARTPLLERYPKARWIGVDMAESMLMGGRDADDRWGARFARWLRIQSDGSAWIAADAARLPFADKSADLVFSNLMLHWHPEPHSVFPEWKRVLRVGGLVMFSCFGPDTLKELRTAVAASGLDARPMPFIDMHDFGDMMVASGFATPVMDVETITLTYATPQALIADVRALGGNPRDDRPRGLPSGRRARALLDALEAQRGVDGRIALSFEVAQGHAWKPEEKVTGQSTISLERLRAGLSPRSP